MTRHTATTRKVRTKLILEAHGERDESDGYRHRWTTTVSVGLLTARGENLAAVRESLQDQLEALVRSPGAIAALAAEDAMRAEIFQAERVQFGDEAALVRLRIRACGRDPDATQIDPTKYPEDDST